MKEEECCLLVKMVSNPLAQDAQTDRLSDADTIAEQGERIKILLAEVSRLRWDRFLTRISHVYGHFFDRLDFVKKGLVTRDNPPGTGLKGVLYLNLWMRFEIFLFWAAAVATYTPV
jgi:hypothetical protein